VLVVTSTDVDHRQDWSSAESLEDHETSNFVSTATGSGGNGYGTPRAARLASTWVPTSDRVKTGEALPCTGPDDPLNFDAFSPGPSVGGLHLTETVRRCDSGAFADESPANYVAYVYGDCKQPQEGSGCAPPLQVHTWPACQRTFADYSFEGEPLPHRELPDINGAKVVEIDFVVDNRIEIYTRSSTIVIWAGSRALATKAIDQLRSQGIGEAPAMNAEDPNEGSIKLEPPIEAAMEGNLRCAT
jgi:hypothetical protein